MTIEQAAQLRADADSAMQQLGRVIASGKVIEQYRLRFEVVVYSPSRKEDRWAESSIDELSTLDEAKTEMAGLHPENHRNPIIEKRILIQGAWETV